MRNYSTGATRSNIAGKLQYEGFVSPVVLRRFAQYMRAHQTQENGEMRESDNWQKGMPLDDYMDSMMRHVMDVWLTHRGFSELAEEPNIQEALSALFFNVQGYMFELLVRPNKGE